MSTYTVAVIVGSLRKDSFNRLVAKALTELSPPELKYEFIEIGDLPHYNQDLDAQGTPPEPWVRFRQQIKAADAVLFVTPEYNRSIPGVLKNAIDVGSRPYGSSAWDKKPGGVISVSPGAIGGFGANHHLRQCLVFLNVFPLQQPEAYLGGASELFDEAGKLKNERTRDFLKNYGLALSKWVQTHKAG